MSSCYIVTDIVQDIEGVPETGYAPFNFAPASEGGSYLLFHFTDESFTRVLSALRNGAYMTYGDEGRQVIWDFLKNVEYPVDFCDQVAQALLTCEDVQAALATVITTVPIVQDSIVDMLQANEEFTDYIGSQVIKMTSEQISGKFMGGDCDNSVVAGRVVAIVERLNTNNEDFLEIVEVGTNDEERVSAVISAIPGLSEAPVDEILDILQSLLENFTENYAAAVTEGWKDDVEEDLYCIAKTESEDCSLTYQQLFEYFRDRAGADLTLGSLIKNVIEYVINGDFSNDELIASGMYAIQLGFILTGQDFNGLDLPTIGAITRDALPSTKWEDWDECDEPPLTCAGASQSYDFKQGEHGFVESVAGYGTWHEGEGWGVGSFGFTITVEKAIATPIAKARMYFSQTADGAAFLRNTLANGFGTYTGPSSSGVDDIGYWYEWDGLGGATAGICFQANPADSTQRLILGCLWYA